MFSVILRRLPPSLFRHSLTGVSASAALLVAGCSADISRFDIPTASLAENSSGSVTAPSRERSNLMGYSSAPTYGQSGGDGRESPQASGYGYGSAGGNGDAYSPNRPYQGASGVQRASLDPPPGSYNSAPPTAPRQNSYATVPPIEPRGQRYAALPPANSRAPSYVPPAAAETADRGEAIEVRPGDTVFGIAKRYDVSVTELTSLNGLRGPTLKPGQKLFLPAKVSRTARTPLSRFEAQETARTPLSRSEAQETAAVAPVEAPADWTGSYTLKPGDSLYALARRNNVKLADVQRYNGISDVRRVKPGAVLKMPGGASEPAPVRLDTRVAPIVPSITAGSGEPPQLPQILNGSPPSERRVAELEPKTIATDAGGGAEKGSVADNSKLRWPVTGQIITPFGPRPDGTHNDGVNIAAPMGTDIHAAESGVVAYADDELKGYGNLVLLRHDNGWVTAYAHADKLTVKRGDHVKRGQVIAKAGRSGQVDQPQVHFELRQGQKPVDPTPFMERL